MRIDIKLRYIASDTGKEYDCVWNDAAVLPTGPNRSGDVFSADYVPGLKNRWCRPGLEEYADGTMTIACYDENTIETLLLPAARQHNGGTADAEE